MKRSTGAIALYVALVFASGMVVGGFGHYLYTVKSVSAKTRKTPEEYRKEYVDEMRTRLHLNSAQLQKLNVVLDDTRDQYRVFREKTKPEMKRIQESQTDQIRSFLDESQQQLYEKMRAEREAARKASGDSGGGGM
jgi:flagellar motility protein MotE (MotC chaperone)